MWHQPTIFSLPSSYPVSSIASFQASGILLPTSLSAPEQAPECWQSSYQRPGPGNTLEAHQCFLSSTCFKFFLRKMIQGTFVEVIWLRYFITFSGNGQKISCRKRNLRLKLEEVTDLYYFDQGYSTVLRTLTSGSATFTLELSNYQAMNPQDQSTLLSRRSGLT